MQSNKLNLERFGKGNCLSEKNLKTVLRVFKRIRNLEIIRIGNGFYYGQAKSGSGCLIIGFVKAGKSQIFIKHLAATRITYFNCFIGN